MRLVLLACLAVHLGARPRGADSRGVVRVIDADTLEVGGTRVRLHGVDAPEAAQLCQDALGRDWPCGAWATAYARALWDGGQAFCVLVKWIGTGVRCRAAPSRVATLGAALVASGAALAFVAHSSEYLPEERVADAAGRGLWRGSFEPPWEWRRGASADGAGSGACAVKGNLSDRGRIYHLPGAPAYGATWVDEAAGERWFCSVAEAEAAGWRAARQQ
jgi:endonuclease YncB( thermonuclease family)